MVDLETFRRGDSVLRRLNAHILRRDGNSQRMADTPDNRRNNPDTAYHLESQQEQAQMVKQKFQKEEK